MHLVRLQKKCLDRILMANYKEKIYTLSCKIYSCPKSKEIFNFLFNYRHIALYIKSLRPY